MAKPRIINKHHQIYGSPEHPEQERVVRIYKGEHECLSKMNLYTRKSISRGFIQSLKLFIILNEDRAKEV